MKSRRDFLRLTGAAGLSSAVGAASFAQSPESSSQRAPATAVDDRDYWLNCVERLSRPMLEALAERRLKATMPVETGPAGTTEDRETYAHLEAFGRLLCGIAPWLELEDGVSGQEADQRSKLKALAREGLDAATDPDSPDSMNFSIGGQPLVDAAFLAQAFIRAPRALWEGLDARVQGNVIAALKKTRQVNPAGSNWILFCAEVEAWLHRVGEERIDSRLTDQLRQYQEWYLGDGMYGDGPRFHADYYNSYVIQPMLLDVVETVRHESPEFEAMRESIRRRLTRYAEIQERLIAPDGSFPPLGRSLTYRGGAFQGLALAALEHLLPPTVTPGQARAGLTAVVRRTLSSADNWDSEGWLRIGLSGHQPSLAERYICTGSLYLCSSVLLPLGLAAADPFWTEAAKPGSWEQNWSGQDAPADSALRE